MSPPSRSLSRNARGKHHPGAHGRRRTRAHQHEQRGQAKRQDATGPTRHAGAKQQALDESVSNGEMRPRYGNEVRQARSRENVAEPLNLELAPVASHDAREQRPALTPLGGDARHHTLSQTRQHAHDSAAMPPLGYAYGPYAPRDALGAARHAPVIAAVGREAPNGTEAFSSRHGLRRREPNTCRDATWGLDTCPARPRAILLARIPVNEQDARGDGRTDKLLGGGIKPSQRKA